MGEPHARRYLAYLALLLFVLVTGYGLLLSAFRDRLFTFYAQQLNAWVADGGDVKAVQSQVVEACSKLVISQAGLIEQLILITFYSDEFDYRVDICTKMTVNRLYEQSAFSKPDLVNMICEEPIYHGLFQRLCQMSGLRSP